MLWRTPVLAGMRLPVVLKLPDGVTNLKQPVVQELADSLVERRCDRRRAERARRQAHRVRRLQLTITDVLVRVELLDGTDVDDDRAPVAAVGRDRRLAARR